MGIYCILLIPIVLAVASYILGSQKAIRYLNSIGYFIGFILSSILLHKFAQNGITLTYNNFIYLDALSVFYVFVILTVAFAAALFSAGQIEYDLKEKIVSEKKAKLFYVLFNVFLFSMMFLTVVNNLGIMWAAVEITTLVSAFLVGFYNKKDSVEAAWKYVIICSVGIVLALLGTILFSYNLLFAAGIKTLAWTEILQHAAVLDPNLLKIAFIFIIVGYGTKAGLAPMHTWLPDAHSQAITPASALLSGLLLNTAMYAIIRYSIIVNKCIGSAFSSHLLIMFGIISLSISAGFILVQKDIKRMLAYSSIEHMGLISVGFGLGGFYAIFGSLLHILNHAVTKSLMFFCSGNIINTYKKHDMRSIRGIMSIMPLTGTFFIIGTFALAGFPPFSIFRSELLIIFGAFMKGSFILGTIVLLLVAFVFAALIFHVSQMLFGQKPKELIEASEPVSSKYSLFFLLIFILTLGIFIPNDLSIIITQAAKIVGEL